MAVAMPLWYGLKYLNNYWINMTFCREIHVPKRENAAVFSDPLTLLLAPL